MPPVNSRRISFLGEFGGLGHPVTNHVWRYFDQGAIHGKSNNGSWGYGGVKDTSTAEGLANTYKGLIDRLIPMVEKGLGGSIYTQTTDVELEINGLLTYDRKVLKFDSKFLKEVHEVIYRRFEEAVK